MGSGLQGDQERARLDKTELFRYKKEINCLKAVLRKKERLLAMITGFVDGKRWMVCCTQSRLIFLFQLAMAQPEVKEIQLERITSVETQLGILFGKVIITDDSDKTIIKNIAKKKTKLFADTVIEAMDRRKKVVKGTVESI